MDEEPAGAKLLAGQDEAFPLVQRLPAGQTPHAEPLAPTWPGVQ